MAQHNLRLEITDKCTLKPQCQHDKSLMEVFSASNISDFKLFYINCCRIYLQVTSVADISTADGTPSRNRTGNQHFTNAYFSPNHPIPSN